LGGKLFQRLTQYDKNFNLFKEIIQPKTECQKLTLYPIRFLINQATSGLITDRAIYQLNPTTGRSRNAYRNRRIYEPRRTLHINDTWMIAPGQMGDLSFPGGAFGKGFDAGYRAGQICLDYPASTFTSQFAANKRQNKLLSAFNGVLIIVEKLRLVQSAYFENYI
jgi:hypothetical protein